MHVNTCICMCMYTWTGSNGGTDTEDVERRRAWAQFLLWIEIPAEILCRGDEVELATAFLLECRSVGGHRTRHQPCNPVDVEVMQ